MDKFTQQPSEVIGYVADFSQAIADGDSIAGVLSSRIVSLDAMPAVPGAAILDTALSATEPKVRMRIAGIPDGSSYKVTAIVQTVQGETLEHDFIVKGREM